MDRRWAVWHHQSIPVHLHRWQGSVLHNESNTYACRHSWTCIKCTSLSHLHTSLGIDWENIQQPASVNQILTSTSTKLEFGSGMCNKCANIWRKYVAKLENTRTKISDAQQANNLYNDTNFIVVLFSEALTWLAIVRHKALDHLFCWLFSMVTDSSPWRRTWLFSLLHL